MGKRREVVEKHYHQKQGQVHFRVLCSLNAVGGLIGSRGSIANAMEIETNSRISADAFGPRGCNHRIVHILGSYSFSRVLLLDGCQTKLSFAQDALLRVFDRMLQVKAKKKNKEEEEKEVAEVEGGGIVKFGLVVGSDMVGAVMGKGGYRISNVRVLPLVSPLPPGVSTSDALLQISGGLLPVKKTLATVSYFIQQKIMQIETGDPAATSSMSVDRSLKMNTSKGDVHFRVLCNSYAVGGIIGSYGNNVKALEKQTTTDIYADVLGPRGGCKYRIVHILGSYSLTRILLVDGCKTKLSFAQDGLLRVFDRMLEAEAEAGKRERGGIVKCCLVVGSDMLGTVVGQGRYQICDVVKDDKVCVEVLSLGSPLPPGAHESDVLVQITGGVLPVKKTLAAVSTFIQQMLMQIESGDPAATSSMSVDRSLKMNTSNAQVYDTDNEEGVAKVVFKLICPYYAAGFVIGPKGRIVKSIEEETKASIFFSALDADFVELVATISAFEHRESQYSFAQNAAVRVFNELVSSEEETTVTTRLLIQPDQSDWLSGGEGSLLSTINNSGAATLKIMDLDYVPVGATANEKVLQIDGDYPNVQTALFQVTWKLRESVFGPLSPKDSLPLLPHKLVNLPSNENKISDLTNKMQNSAVSEEANSSLPPMSPHSQFSAGSSLTSSPRSSGDSAIATGGSNICSGSQPAIVTNKTLEISVRENVFSAVYGEDGSNLSRMRQISGATVEVYDPCSGSDGKLIISGTPHQTLVAETLLKTFLMSAA